MLKLNDRKWKEFKIENVFNVGGTITTKPQVLIAKGNTPRVTCAAVNNGLDGLYNNESTEEKGVITIDSATVGAVFYQPYDFIATDHVEKLKLKNRYMNRYIGLFLKSAIDKAKGTKYDYGYKFSQTRIKRQSFKLPIDKNENIDYDFMEQFIKEREEIKRKEYLEYAKKKLNEIEVTISKTNGGGVEYKVVRLKELFDIYTGGDLIISKIKKGDVPVVSHTALNNGISIYADLIAGRKLFNYKKTISLADRGNFKAYAQVRDFYIGTRVKALEIKEDINYYALIFLSQLIDKQSVKFSYGYNACDNTGNIKIVIPYNNGKPDYSYMSELIKTEVIDKYKQYMSYCGKFNL